MQPHIIQKPICFDAQRIALTQHYIRDHYGIDAPDITIIPKIIVLHWTAIATLEESFACLYPSLLSNRPDITSQETEVNVSAHFLVDRDGSIYQLMPNNWMARHVIGLNYSAIGVENVGGANGVADLTEAQVKANVMLVQYLCGEFNTIAYLIGHHEYQNFRGSSFWLEKNPDYFTEKEDPGEVFMGRVRQLCCHPELAKDLHLLAAPNGDPSQARDENKGDSG